MLPVESSDDFTNLIGEVEKLFQFPWNSIYGEQTR